MKLKLFVFLLSFFIISIIAPKPVSAALNSCKSITTDLPNGVVNINEDQEILVTIEIVPFEGFDPSNFEIAYRIPSFLNIGWSTSSVTQISSSDETITLRASIPYSIYQDNNNSTYEVFIQTKNPVQHLLNVTDNNECKTTFSTINTATNRLCSNDTEEYSYTENMSSNETFRERGYYRCQWDFNNQVWITHAYHCNGSFVPSRPCNTSSPIEGSFDESLKWGFCDLCETPTTPTKDWGEQCVNTSECMDALECRTSIQGDTPKCLHPIGSARVGAQCLVGQNECDESYTAFTSIIVNNYCDDSTSSENNTVSTCQILENTRCNEQAGNPCPDGQQCVNGECIRNTPSIPPPTPYLTLAPTLGPTPTTNPGNDNPGEGTDPSEGFKIKYCPEGTVGEGIQTAFGCLPTTIGGMTLKIFQIAIGMGGGIAFLLIIYGGFMIIISSGDPKKLQEGKEIITSAIVGLLMVLFSIIILRIIGLNILGIPGFGISRDTVLSQGSVCPLGSTCTCLASQGYSYIISSDSTSRICTGTR